MATTTSLRIRARDRHWIAPPRGINMNRRNHLFSRLAVAGTSVVGLLLITAGQATARVCVAQTRSPRLCPRSGDGYDGFSATPVQQVTSNSDRALQWVLFAAAVFSALAIVAVVADVLVRRRWRQPPLYLALAASDPDELPRAAGLLGDRFVQQGRADAAEHAYRAAVDAGDEYWSPIAQVALAEILSSRGKHVEAQALLEAAIASGQSRTASLAQTALSELSTGGPTHGGIRLKLSAYETISDPATARRSRDAQRGPAVAGRDQRAPGV